MAIRLFGIPVIPTPHIGKKKRNPDADRIANIEQILVELQSKPSSPTYKALKRKLYANPDTKGKNGERYYLGHKI